MEDIHVKLIFKNSLYFFYLRNVKILMKFRKSHLLIIFFLILFSSGIINNNCDISRKVLSDFSKKDIRSSKNSVPFLIDGNQGWVDFRNAGNCTGEGTYSEPYIIEDLVINGGGNGRLIEIRYSTVYFIIENCIITNGGEGIYLYNVTNGRFINNNISNNYYGMYVHFYCKNNTIISNNFEANDEIGIYLLFTYSDNKIYDNYFTNNGLHGIDLSSSNGNYISGNIIKDTGDGSHVGTQEFGILLINDARYNVISNNTILNSNHEGVRISGSRYNSILNNKIHKNKGTGLHIYYYGTLSTYNTIKGNIITNNSGTGIHIETLENNFTQNLIQNNNFGVHAQSINNLIYNNTFIGNTGGNAGDIANYWNNSVIGNYWDDYNGKDVDDNGIGETPYRISSATGGSYDFLPIWFDGPTINITFPLNYTVFTSNLNPPSFSLEILDPNLNKIWYTINSQPKKYFINSSGTINYDKWINLMNGNILLTFYANDSFGNINSQQIIIIKETPPPQLLILEPLEGFIYSTIAPNYNLTIIDLPFNISWYTLDNGKTNYTTFNIFSNNTYGMINQTVWDSFQDGLITVKFYGKDIVGRIVYNEVDVYKDVADPIVIINYPTINATFGEISPQFNLTIIEANLISSWYSVNGGFQVNFTGSTGKIDQTSWNLLPEGTIIIRFYAKDIAGKIGYQDVTIIKELEEEIINDNSIPGYNIIILLIILSLFLIIQFIALLKRRQ